MSKIITLSHKERSQLEYLLKKCPTVRQHQRIQALLLLDEGVSVEELAEWLRVSRQSIYNWVNRFQERAQFALLERVDDDFRSGRPPSAKGIIDPLIDSVIDSDPRDFQYNSTVWTASLLQIYLQERHRQKVCLRSISYALERLRLRWKRPRHTLARRAKYWRQAKAGLNAGSNSAKEQSS